MKNFGWIGNLTKARIRRFARLLGIEVLKNPRYVRALHSSKNFPDISDRPVIFDVGANIGQSVMEFKLAIQNPVIHAFEPVTSIHRVLLANTKNLPNVHTYRLAIGDQNKTIEIPRIDSKTVTTTRVLGDFGDVDGATETVEVTTLDCFAESRGIERIDILKTDTEGFDLNVCRGASGLLQSKRISYLISEVSLDPERKQNSYFFPLNDFLLSHGYELVSLFDLDYGITGPLRYFNALYRAKP